MVGDLGSKGGLVGETYKGGRFKAGEPAPGGAVRLMLAPGERAPVEPVGGGVPARRERDAARAGPGPGAVSRARKAGRRLEEG